MSQFIFRVNRPRRRRLNPVQALLRAMTPEQRREAEAIMARNAREHEARMAALSPHDRALVEREMRQGIY